MPVPPNVLPVSYRVVMAEPQDDEQDTDDAQPEYGSREWAEYEYECGGNFGWGHRR